MFFLPALPQGGKSDKDVYVKPTERKVFRSSMEAIIKVKNLKYAYSSEDGGTGDVIKGVNLEIERGSFTAIIGRNGSGKSTLAKLMCGIYTPSEGCVEVSCSDGGTYSTSDESHFFDIRKTAGMVFQNPDNQLVATVVEEDVAFAPENLGVPTEEIRKRVDDALKIVGLTEFVRHDTHKLSGGQKQRVAIAGVLAMLPDCIIFDESTAMLDPRGREEIMRTVEKLRRERSITAVMITHYMNEAALADRVVLVDDGKILADGSPREIFSDTRLLAKTGLEAPQSTTLALRLASATGRKVRTPLNADEAAEEIAVMADTAESGK